jgi:hypothetical protein
MEKHIHPILNRLLRWSAGFLLTTLIIAGMLALYPFTGESASAHFLTWSLAVIIGLKVALPPLNPDDEWLKPKAEPDQIQPAEETHPKAGSATYRSSDHDLDAA